MDKINIKKYFVAFLITAVVFISAIWLSNYFNDRRIQEIQSIQDQISIDILSSETQFDLLSAASCKILDESVLSQELNELSSRLSFMEESLGTNNSQVQQLKRYYSLLQIKDYLLMKRLSDKCNVKPVSILYFYSNKGDCEDCKKEGYVLTYLREEYPRLRVYAFDFNLDLGAIKTIESIYKLSGEMPTIIIDDTPYYGFKSVEDIEKLVPDIKSLADTASTTATSTVQNSTTTKNR